MKKLILLTGVLLCTNLVNSQITDTGDKVGIGTTNPVSKLEINGDVSLYRGHKIKFLEAVNGQDRAFITSTNGENGNYNSLVFAIGGGTEAMRIHSANGNVGIGTTNPGKNLEIKGGDGIGIRLFNEAANTWDILNTQYGKLDFVRGGSNTFMRIDQHGNIGVGTTTPREKMHLEGNFLLDVYNQGQENGVFFRESFSDSNIYNLSILTYDHSTSGTTPDGLSINAYDGVSFSTGSNSRNERMRIHKNGNVGIGITDPLEKFQIGNGYAFHDGGHKVLFFGYASGGNDLISDGYAGEMRFDPVNGNLRLGTSNTITDGPITRVSINKNGNVGIGTTDPKGYKLAVAGKVVAEEVKVALRSNWPDYVFYKDYDLPTLEEVEQHIQEKGHLKDVPNAGEVEENGILLGEMDAKLLQKIEELTLYTIQQQKEIDLLKKNNKVLNEENTVIKTILKRLEIIESKIKNKE